MKCIVICKRQISTNNLIEYINKVPYLELISYCASVFEAYEVLQSHSIDLLFVDTNLPDISGLDFIKSLDNKPIFIFTSTDASLAIEGYNLNALDFLLLPFSFNRFLRAANKAFEYYSLRKKLPAFDKDGFDYHNNDFILVKSEYQTIKININEILYIEGLKDYIKIYTSNNLKPVITLNSLKKLQNNLPSEQFSRIHKSYIIGLKHISSINKSQVIINDKYIPVGESYKNIFMSKLEELRI
ncbi:MAG: response regulator transcription factor [Prolixibacteraceae bacterium]|nr:response regulator transcription factor [Prolixibacteraceae bacterium]